ncbi:hypothetical protein [Pseudonocardia zijingensis]|uniref:MmpS family membrane protein n=1 Tax=Pseudonocardia zijingensis TaxID=153376 RepID=A0ABN1QVU9_9PSEU
MGSSGRPRGCVIALLVVAALVVLPVGWLAYALFHTDRWVGEVPAVVTGIDDDGRYFRVEFTAPLPEDALAGRPESAATPDGGLVFEMLPDVQVGDHVLCTVEQTFTVNTDLGHGPVSRIERCRRPA